MTTFSKIVNIVEKTGTERVILFKRLGIQLGVHCLITVSFLHNATLQNFLTIHVFGHSVTFFVAKTLH